MYSGGTWPRLGLQEVMDEKPVKGMADGCAGFALVLYYNPPCYNEILSNCFVQASKYFLYF